MRVAIRRKGDIRILQELEMNGTKVLGVAAVSAFLSMAAPMQHAQALSLINPGTASSVQENSKLQSTEVHWHWHHHHWGWHHRHWHRWRHW
jgi:hypothetical protein